MARFTYLLATFVLCQTISVFAKPQFDEFGFETIDGSADIDIRDPPVTPTAGTTTTTSSPRFTSCVTQCQSQITSEYNPVCGTNGLTYNNVKNLKCAQKCGLNVQVARGGTCRSTAGG